MLRCAASSVIAAYGKVRLIPYDLYALYFDIFEQPAKNAFFNTLLYGRFKNPAGNLDVSGPDGLTPNARYLKTRIRHKLQRQS